jgi:hypothetical protein
VNDRAVSRNRTPCQEISKAECLNWFNGTDKNERARLQRQPKEILDKPLSKTY